MSKSSISDKSDLKNKKNNWEKLKDKKMTMKWKKKKIKKRSLQNQTVIKAAVQLSGLSFPQDVRGVAKACRCEDGTREQRACCFVFDTLLKAHMFTFSRSACGGLQLAACFWGVLIASSLPPGKTPSLTVPPLFFSSPPPLPINSFSQSSLTLSSFLCFSISPSPQGSRFG